MTRNSGKASDLLDLAVDLLAAGRPQDAVELIRKHGAPSAELYNLQGVALMRTGDAVRALQVFRNICINESGFCLKRDLPTAVKANYATALLLSGNATGCRAILRETDETAPYVLRLQAAIDRWRRSVGWWERFAFDWYGVEPEQPIPLDFEPGIIANEQPRLRPAA